MSGRGGRGGRGGSGAGRIVQSLLRDNMEDMGMPTSFGGKPTDGVFDDCNQLPPPLYPIISIQTPKPLVDGNDMFAVQKVIDIQYKCEMSPYFLKKCVVMSGDRRRKFAAQQNIRQYSDRYSSKKKECFDTSASEACEYDGGDIVKYLKTNINNNDLNPFQQQIVLNTYFPNELFTEVEKKKKKRLFAPNSSSNSANTDSQRKRKHASVEDDEEYQVSKATVALDVETVKNFVDAVGNEEEGGRKRSRSVSSNAAEADDADSGEDDSADDASMGDDDYGVNYYESDNDNGSDGDDDGGAY